MKHNFIAESLSVKYAELNFNSKFKNIFPEEVFNYSDPALCDGY